MAAEWRNMNPGETLGQEKYLQILDEAIVRAKAAEFRAKVKAEAPAKVLSAYERRKLS